MTSHTNVNLNTENSALQYYGMNEIQGNVLSIVYKYYETEYNSKLFKMMRSFERKNCNSICCDEMNHVNNSPGMKSRRE